jgi:hypothetical protein
MLPRIFHFEVNVLFTALVTNCPQPGGLWPGIDPEVPRASPQYLKLVSNSTYKVVTPPSCSSDNLPPL